MARMHGVRLVRLIVATLLIVVSLGQTRLVALAATAYAPGQTHDALLTQAMTSAEALFGGEIGRKNYPPDPDFSRATYGVLIFSTYGVLSYEICDSNEAALADARLDILDPYTSPSDPGLTYYILWGAGGANDAASATLVDGNVVISGIATPQNAYDAGLSGSSSGAAALGVNFAKDGLAFLRRVGVRSVANGGSGTTSANALAANPVSAPAPAAVAQRAPAPAASAVLPGGLTAPSGAAYRVERAASLDLTRPFREPTLAYFAPAPAVAGDFRQLGWIDGYTRVYALDNPPAGLAGWVQATVHHFDSDANAEHGYKELAFLLAKKRGVSPASLASAADESTAYSGPGSNGNETTMVAREGPYVVTVTGVAPAGSPDASVRAVVDAAVRNIGG